jgi:hypothetical protein
MSVSGFDQEYVTHPGAEPLYARPLGNLAAAMIGVVAFVVLGAALVFTGDHPSVVESHNDEDALRALAAAAPAAETASPAKQYSAFDISSPEFAKDKKSFAVKQFEGGVREDNLTFGRFASGEAYMRLDIRQPAAEKRTVPDFYLDMARHAAQAGLSVTKISQPTPLSTRFGSFEVADIRLSQPSGEGASTERACLAMRLAGGKQPVEIAGLSCGVPAKPLDRRALGCILDRLDYSASGENKALDAFFLAAEQERGKGRGGTALSPGAAKSSWLDAHSTMPALKNEPAPGKRPRKTR